MYINCISCGHKFDIGKSYDDYEGPVRCPTCRAMLTIRTQDGNVRGVRPGMALLGPTAEQNATPGTSEGRPTAAPQPYAVGEDRRSAA